MLQRAGPGSPLHCTGDARSGHCRDMFSWRSKADGRERHQCEPSLCYLKPLKSHLPQLPDTRFSSPQRSRRCSAQHPTWDRCGHGERCQAPWSGVCKGDFGEPRAGSELAAGGSAQMRSLQRAHWMSAREWSHPKAHRRGRRTAPLEQDVVTPPWFSESDEDLPREESPLFPRVTRTRAALARSLL